MNSEALEEMRLYQDMEDAELAERARRGDNDALDFLMSKYKNHVRKKARSYFLIGADRDDLIQEGMIGLYKAIRSYDADKRKSFYAFAELCITRQMITAIKTATRKKHFPLNSYVSLDGTAYESDDASQRLIDVTVGMEESTPEQIYLEKESIRDINKMIDDKLSLLERDVLEMYLMGYTYGQIASMLDKPQKSVDNALQRAKAKLLRALS